MQLPLYRHIFDGLCLIEHSRGYRLPRYKQFCLTYLQALYGNPRYQSVKSLLFISDQAAQPALLHRVGGWYIDGLRHTHLYCALVQAFEEQRRIGVVLMDVRADVKFKTDLLIATPNRMARVSIEAETGSDQDALIAHRTGAEQFAKANNQTSSQRDNPFHDTVFTTRIAAEEANLTPHLGVKLFSGAAIDDLIKTIDAHLGIPSDIAISYQQMKKVTMGHLNSLNNAGRIPRFTGKADLHDSMA